jgi:crossover junction endodeoxyribonuclease RuvC
MRRVIGIDPGITGGIAALDIQGDTVEVVCATATPTCVGTRNRKPVPDYDVRAMYRLLADLVENAPCSCMVILERATTRPAQHAAAVLRTGEGWGLWRGIIGTLGCEYVCVQPAVWKRRANLLHTDKKASVLRAKDRFPALASLTASQHGIADAVLIAATAAAC